MQQKLNQISNTIIEANNFEAHENKQLEQKTDILKNEALDPNMVIKKNY